MAKPRIDERKQGRLQVFEAGTRNRYPVEAGSTSSNFSAFGLTHFGSTSGAKTYTVDAPEPGVRKYLSCTDASTNNVQTVQLSADGSVQLGGSTNWKIAFDAPGEGVTLIARSASKWEPVAGYNSTSIAFTT